MTTCDRSHENHHVLSTLNLKLFTMKQIKKHGLLQISLRAVQTWSLFSFQKEKNCTCYRLLKMKFPKILWPYLHLVADGHCTVLLTWQLNSKVYSLLHATVNWCPHPSPLLSWWITLNLVMLPLFCVCTLCKIKV